MLLGIVPTFNKVNTSSGFVLELIHTCVVSSGENLNCGTFHDFSFHLHVNVCMNQFMS